jgi:hypothetical protein
MIDKLLFTFVVLFATLNSQAQSEIPTFDQRHKNIYAEFMGSHLLAGVNFDMRLKKGVMDGIGFRVGVGGLTAKGQDANNVAELGLVTFPIELNYVVGKKRSSMIAGVGVLPAYATIKGEGEITNYEYIEEEGFGVPAGFLTLGYRFQPLKTGVMFQVHWNPMIVRGSGFQPGWFGAGIGIGFK